MSITTTALMQQRRDTAANWTSNNPTLLNGEIGYETDTGYLKIGDGSTAWTSLGYVDGTKVSAYPLATADIANDAITADKLADTSVTAGSYTAADITVDAQGRITAAASGTIGTSEIADDAVTGDKLANDITIANDLTVTNNLTVNGTTTTINSTTLQVDDKNIELGTVATPSDTTADGGGITLKGTTDHTITWTNSTDSWDFSEHVNIASAKEFRIAGTKVLDATSLGSAVVTSSLTSVGTIATGVWNGTPIATAYIADDAVTAAKLADTAVTAGSYTAADITVDAQGRITAAASGAISTAEIADSAVTTAKINDDAVTAAKLADTSVTAGSYTTADITVDAQGRITAASSGSAGAVDKLSEGNTEAEVVDTGSDGHFKVTTEGTERLRIVSSGNVGINTTSPTSIFDVEIASNTGINFTNVGTAPIIDFKANSVESAGRIRVNESGGGGIMQVATKTTGGTITEAFRVDNQQRVFVGLTSTVDANIGGTGYGNLFQIQGDATGEGLMVANTADFARINMVRRANVATDTQLGTISFGQSASINPLERARISCFSETTGGTGGLGGNLRFYTSADGSFSPTERARIDNSGRLLVGRTSSTGSGEDIQDSKGGIRAIPQTSKTAAYTLVVGDVGKHVNITTGGVTIPSGVFSVGDAVSIYNDSSSSQTITQGSSVTLRLAGDGGTGNKTLAGYGLCTVLCVTSNEFVIAGTGLS